MPPTSPHDSTDDIADALVDAVVEPSTYWFRQWSGWILGPVLLDATLLLQPPQRLSAEGWRTAGAAAPYSNPIIYLFLGGFIIALAMQRWNLHRRVAITLISALGTRPTRMIADFPLSPALVSMWVSNTATALMMLLIATSVVLIPPAGSDANPGLRGFSTTLVLSVAYGATTGGMATLIGPAAACCVWAVRCSGHPAPGRPITGVNSARQTRLMLPHR
jgi:di/tricarboxylate transporter